MKKFLTLIFILASAFNLLFAQTVVSKWSGYTYQTPPSDGIFLATGGTAANIGIATLTRETTEGITFAVNQDLYPSSNYWQDGANTKYWITQFSTVGCTNLKFTSKQQASNTGPKYFKVQYRVGVSGTWTDVPNGTVTVANDSVLGVLENIPLPPALNNQAQVFLRWLCTSTVAVNGSAVAQAGTSRLNATIFGDIEITLPTIFANPASLNFGSVEKGTVSEPKTVTVSGALLTNIITYAKSGADAAAFTIEETSWNPATGGTLAITFAPTEIRAYSASLTFSSTGADNVVVSLTGTGIKPLGQLIAKWNEYTTTFPDPHDPLFLATGGSEANNGIATLTRENEDAGCVVNNDGVAASSGWDNATTNEKYWITTFSTAGFTDITFTSKQRGSNTGPKDFKVQYKAGTSGTWTDVEDGTIIVKNDNYISGVKENIELPEAMNHQEVAFLRWICTSTVSINDGVVGDLGVNRLDVTIYGVSGTAPFVPVTDIINVPTTAAINVPLTLSGTVLPNSATNKTIVWTVKDAGGTGATITGNTFLATQTGTAKITATIEDGLAVGEPFIKEFSIEVKETIVYYTITATVNNSAFGTITPAGEIEVEEGGSKTFIITPNANHKIADVLVNDVSQGALETYTFDDVQSDGTIHVIFEKLSINENEFSSIIVYSYQNSVYIKSAETDNYLSLSAEILDMNGRLIYKNNLNNSESVITLHTPNGIYFVRLISPDGRSMSKKVWIMR
jgi:hypothetical protein